MSKVDLILANVSATIAAVGYLEADYRLPVETLPQGGTHGRFQVSESPSIVTFSRLAILDNVHQTGVLVKVKYFRGGGNAGGEGGGDRLTDNARAMDRALTMGLALIDSLTYDQENTGIRRRLVMGVKQSADLRQATVWDLELLIEWEEPTDVRAVA